jgi:hypothetical protein
MAAAARPVVKSWVTSVPEASSGTTPSRTRRRAWSTERSAASPTKA